MTLSPQLVAATIQDDSDLAQSVQDLVAAHPDTASVMARLLVYIQNQRASSSGQPDAKRQRLDSTLASSTAPAPATLTPPPQPDLGPEIYSTTPLSFLHPIRKKAILSFHASDLALVSPSNCSEVLCRAPYHLIHRVISVPFLERTKKQTAIIIFFKHSPITPAKDAIWAVPVSDDGKDMTLRFLAQHKHLAGLDDDLRSTTSVQKPPVKIPPSPESQPAPTLVSLLSYFIHRANPAHYSASVDMIPNPPTPYPHFTAHLKSNSATIYLLPTGILFAFRKPLLFLRSKVIEAVGVHSVMSRTFDFEVVMDPQAAPEDLEGVPLDAKDGRRVVGFGMVDTKEFARMEDWIKKAGIRDRSLSEDLKAKDKAPVSSATGANAKKRERTADDDGSEDGEGGAATGLVQGGRAEEEDDDEEDEDFAPESDDEIMEEYDSAAEGSDSDGEVKESPVKTRRPKVEAEAEESLGEESLGEDSDEEEDEEEGEEEEDEDEEEERGYGHGGENEDEEVDELQDD